MESLVRRLAIESIWPRFCIRCGREGEVFCRPCQEAYRPRISFAACPFCGRGGSDRVCDECGPKTYLDGVISLAAYGDPVVREAIGLWKYHGDEQAQATIELWVRQLAQSLRLAEAVEAVSFIPLHESKKRSRGFDQAQELAKMVARLINRPVQEVLRRDRKTRAQAQLTNEQRLVGDLDGIFRVQGNLPQSVVLCDDVFTSGATMDAAARELKEHGVKTVFGLTLAKGSLKT
ncbi:hypothetical protein KJ611_03765 [Patescibacteria group bacterium]|nr:hypothetical protein [Patescibacteria group bacterium]MBU1705726.1 hypothetical protein [Patescibacteria group bacterium]